MSKCFKRNARLCHSKDFQYLFRKGHLLRNAHCRVYVRKNPYQINRLGVIVAKKVVPLSTRRHQWKRIVRESFRLNTAHLSYYDVIIMLKKSPDSKTHLWTTLDLVWQQLTDYANT